MSWLELDDEMLDQASQETENVSEGFKQIESGAYKSKIVQAYLRKTDTGAVMFELEVEVGVPGEDGKVEPRKLEWSTCVVSGDEKGNKSTWTVTDQHSDSVKKRYGVGAEVPLPGIPEVSHLMQSVGLNIKTEKPEPAKVKRGDSEIDAKVFKNLTGKMFTACVRQYENEYNGEVNIKAGIEHFLDIDGKNSKGSYEVEKFQKKIEKSPIKLLKKKQASTNNSDQQAAVAAASGW